MLPVREGPDDQTTNVLLLIVWLEREMVVRSQGIQKKCESKILRPNASYVQTPPLVTDTPTLKHERRKRRAQKQEWSTLRKSAYSSSMTRS
jgi:hypothetical protein